MEKSVSANALRQAKFAAKKREEGRKKISIWVSKKQEAKIRAFLKGAQLIKAVSISPGKELPKIVMDCEEVEATLYPYKKIKGPVATVAINDGTVRVRLDRFCENTNKILKGHRFRWEKPVWMREVHDPSVIEHRAVDIALRLMRGGCPVRIRDKRLRDKIIASDYEPEPSRILDVSHREKYGTQFLLSWFSDDNMGYDFRPRQLPGAKVFDYACFVDPLYFDSVLDFAEQHGFAITEAAAELIDKGQEIRDQSLSIRPRVKNAPLTVIPERPQATGEIYAELADV